MNKVTNGEVVLRSAKHLPFFYSGRRVSRHEPRPIPGQRGRMSAALTRRKVPVKILTADDHPLLREALTRLITELGVDTEVLETEGPPRGGGAARCTRRFRAGDPRRDASRRHRDRGGRTGDARPAGSAGARGLCKDDPETARAVLDAGARDFISKRSPTRVLAEAIGLVLVGGTYVRRRRCARARYLNATRVLPSASRMRSPRLSARRQTAQPRQFEALRLLVQGKPNKLICRSLSLAEGTVKTHTAAIYRALGVANRTQAVYAVSRLSVAFASTTA